MSAVSRDKPDDMSRAAADAAARWDAAATAAALANAALPPFRAAVSASSAGTNANPSKVHFYTHREPAAIVSTFAFQSATVGERLASEIVYGKEPWGPLRHTVESALDALETAVYATLDCGGTVGTSRYGRYRLAFTPSGKRPSIVFPHNTASQYGSLSIDGAFEAMASDVSAWENRGDLAAAHLADAITVDTSIWAGLLAAERPSKRSASDSPEGDFDLIEIVCRDGDIPIDQVSEIRIEREYTEDMERRLAALLRDVSETVHTDADEEILLYSKLSSAELSSKLIVI